MTGAAFDDKSRFSCQAVKFAEKNRKFLLSKKNIRADWRLFADKFSFCFDLSETNLSFDEVYSKEIEVNLVGIPEDYIVGFDRKNWKIFKADGCEQCGHTGFKGRLGIFEVLPMLAELQEMAFKEVPAHVIYEEGLKIGMINMKQDGIIKVLRGETTMEEIARVTSE